VKPDRASRQGAHHHHDRQEQAVNLPSLDRTAPLGRPAPKLLVIAPNHPRFAVWCRDRGLSARLASFVSHERDLRGVANRHVVIVDGHDCPWQLVQLVRHLAARYRIHESTTADRPALPGDELRAQYGNQCEALAGAAPVLHLLGRDDIDPYWAVAFRYTTLEALEAFSVGNREHYGYETIGPDGALYGVTVLPRPSDSEPGDKHDDAAAANTR
jgi:hypothetical protein